MRLSSGFELKRARVEMLPLIDVVFLLLVFFIYAMLSMVLQRGIDVALPAASASAVTRLQHVAVSVTDNNQILVNREHVSLDALTQAVLTRLQASGADQLVYIECDEQADAGLAIRILGQLREAGVEEVMFATREHP